MFCVSQVALYAQLYQTSLSHRYTSAALTYFDHFIAHTAWDGVLAAAVQVHRH